jgi:hypothetical protein
MFFLAVSLWMQVQAAQPAGQSGNVDVRATFQPETVTIGQHFIVKVVAHAPASVVDELIFPNTTDTSQTQGAISAFAVLQRHDVPAPGGYVDVTVTYSLVPWVVGKIAMGDVVVGKRHIKIPGMVTVASVLPRDSVAKAKALPKPLRELLIEPPLYKRIIRAVHKKSYLTAIIIGVLALVALIAWILWRRSRQVEVDTGVSPEWVEHEFQRVESLHLLDRGET